MAMVHVGHVRVGVREGFVGVHVAVRLADRSGVPVVLGGYFSTG